MDILLVEDKHGTYVKSDERGVEFAALDLLRSRVSDGWWYDSKAQTRAREITRADDADGALDFLLERVDHEYEYVEVQETR